MATTTAGFPRLPERQWWALRDRFKQSIPSRVTPSYLATVLDMKESSAQANILPALKAVGLIDAEGVPTEVARRWRDDSEYPSVVKEMRERIYPDELLDAIPDPSSDRPSTERWFANRTGLGEAAVQKMAQFYELLCDGDPLRGQNRVSRPKNDAKEAGPRPRAKPVRPAESIRRLPAQGDPNSTEAGARPNDRPRPTPELHIDIQIHISPEASAEQIDQIFASMAKHLYTRGE